MQYALHNRQNLDLAREMRQLRALKINFSTLVDLRNFSFWQVPYLSDNREYR